MSFINTFVTGDRILLLTDTPNIRNTHSIFLKLIKGRGHSVTIRSVDNPSLSLLRYGERLYDHLIIFAPTTEKYADGLSAKALSSFINEGGNVLAAGGMKIGSALRELAIQSGFEFDEDGTAIIDHFNYDTVLDNGEHTTIVAYPSQLIAAPVIVGDAGIQGPVLFRGVAIDADESNRLCLRLLTASTTAYSFRPDHRIDEYPMVVGRSQLLVGALQTRSNARVLFAGSLDMFSDVFISSTVNKTGSTSGPTRSGNLQLITELTKWVMMEKGVLRLNSVKHHRVGENHFPRQYTIMNHVEYAMDVEELKNGKWTPFNATDVQLEVVRMDPFLRTSLVNTEGKLRARFKLPDVYGVFKFVVDYHRTGYTNLHHVSQVSVRPLMHTQYERFIRSAYPYYFSSFSMMIGVLLFSCVFLYHQPNTKGIHKNR
ncbi:Dolichyl-diphosphooligosaccharide--protein glycosyltransferase 48 kDa subunit [Toxocara canis]|uniref:Dolichyl-diphosphooligosaccharide--protein glycosyltransferase 48 kDa subunit n=1 Tax=Toxocara canis TaxID=6265 RepID=A0A0B2VAT7_TOXCA|nr:Dolichyl-diphosphooligosaccharide--protein glycosyltransferase 48 kDa subunit [Toxocara canis]